MMAIVYGDDIVKYFRNLCTSEIARAVQDDLNQVVQWIEIARCKGIQILESGKFLLVESGILGVGIWNTNQGIRNPTNDWR